MSMERSLQMILTDLDGTLLHSDGSVSGYTKRVLRECQEKGILVVVATARYWIGAERYIQEIQPDYEITTDGTLIHRHGERVYSCSLDEGITNRIIQDLLEINPETEITVASGRKVFWNSLYISESEKLHKAVYHDYQKPLSCRANKIVAELSDSETAEAVAEKNNCRLQSYRGENRYAFLPREAGKVRALRELTGMLNIPLDKVAAFGDDLNDLEMLRVCGSGVAVANAVQNVKEAADYVTLSNDQDGVAVWLERNLISTDIQSPGQ